MSEQEASKVAAEEKKPEEKKAEEKPNEPKEAKEAVEKPKAEKKEKPKKKKVGGDEDGDDDKPERPKRDRKRAEQFQTDGAPDGGSRSVEEYEGGSGSKLGDIPNVNVMLTKEKDATMIQTLHRLCYKTVGKKTTQKKRLREFSGLAKETKEATRDRVSRMPVQKLRSVAKIFDCNPEGSEKDDHIDAITKFLLNPKSSGKPLKVERKKGTKRKASKKSDKKGSKKSKKDPNAPKKGLSAYFFFTNEQRENVKKKHPTYSMTDIAKKLGAKWSALSESEKKPYEKMAAKDKLRYEKEKAAYEKKGGSKKAKTEKGKKKKEESESESESESSKDGSDQEESSEEEEEDTKKGKRQREENDGDDEEETPSKKQKDE